MNNDYEEILVKFYVIGSENEKERRRAETIGIKAYGKAARIGNSLIIPLYNKTFDKIFPNYTKEDRLDENKLYTKGYITIMNFIANAFSLVYGGLWLKENKKICINVGFTFKPCYDENSKATHIVDDMIYLKKIL